MELFFKELAKASFDRMQKEEALLAIFEFLSRRLDVSNISCHSVDRNDLIYTSFIDYCIDGAMRGAYSAPIKRIAPVSTIEEYYGKDFRNIFLFTANSMSKQLQEGIGKFAPENFQSAMAMGIYRNKKKDFHLNIIFYSEKENAFSHDKIEMLENMRFILEELILDLYNSNSKSHFFLSASGVLLVDSTAQLRACPDMREVMLDVESVAQHDSTVLILGPTGSGKEIVAESIHTLSPRFENNFVRVNCGAIPESLIESELFGYEKGAFTGAIQVRKGYFEQANNGTIYLDEIGELSKNAQIRLLRVLETHEIQRVGSERPIKLDIRIIAATHRDLWDMVEKNLFREDLYYRINIFPITLMQLNKRRNDIPVLLSHFYQFYVKKFKLSTPPAINDKTLYKLINYAWPGNIRQLRHAVERAMLKAIASKKTYLEFDFLESQHATSSLIREKTLYTVEDIERALEASKGKIQGINGAATILGLNPATLRSRMKALGIPFAKDKNRVNNRKIL